MKYKRKSLMNGLVFFMIVLSVSSLTACLDIGKIDIYLILDKDDLYAGKARFEFVNIHSTAETSAEQKKEMDDFFRDYKQNVEDIIKAMPLYGYSAEFRNKKEFSSDVIIQGEFKNVMAVIGSLMSESSFRFEGNRKKLAVFWANPFTDSTEMNLIVQYQGTIVKHNSKNFNAKDGIMKWNMSKTGDKEVSFIFKSE
jgi:hypothetical protein